MSGARPESGCVSTGARPESERAEMPAAVQIRLAAPIDHPRTGARVRFGIALTRHGMQVQILPGVFYIPFPTICGRVFQRQRSPTPDRA